MRRIVTVLTLLGMAVSPAAGDDWSQAVAQVQSEIRQTRSDAAATDSIIAGERSRLTGELSALNADVAKQEETLSHLKEKFDALLKSEETLRGEIAAGEGEARALAEILRTAGKDAETMLSGSPVTPEHPARQALLGPLLEPDRFPGMADIRNLAEVLFSETEAGGQVLRRTGPFVDDQGNETEGEILRVGKFTTFYRHGDAVGYLRFDPASHKLVEIPGDPPWSVRRAIRKYFSGEADHLPVDLSGGVIVEQVNRNDNIGEWLRAGGLLVWPIIVIGLIAVLLSLERLWSLGRIPTQTDNFMDRLRKLVSEGDLTTGRELCEKKSRIPTCNVLRAGLEFADSAKEVMENALEEAILVEMPRLERFLSTLSVLAAVAPLLGLLGTVTGMIHTFQGITVFGTSDPRMMSGGISEALVTTQLGLAVAIPITIIHHFFDRRVEKIIGDMEEKGTALVTVLIRRADGV
ncbi:flagellar motor protein MotA [Desulfonema ishimotonii]|uniref:Flagellar motor protein MotA n=2 Tax=Desulfonema ishimotonii TaxID=45657 RepID=A0A401FZF2_9BACT|nr:flagellar motor protein MotA [Desulfonema ishimotonii]